MKKALIVIAVIAAILIVLAVGTGKWLMSSYNGLVTLNESVNGAWAQVDNVLKRRSDLIPNLVETVKGYAKHEQEVFANIAEARAALGGAKTVKDKISAAGTLDGALSRLLVVVENYPNLKADANFKELQAELVGTENRIAVERMRYNDIVKQYNLATRKFPEKFVASMFGFTQAEYYEMPEKDRAVPEVKF